ncbi:MAG: ATP-binding protein, partial [Xanthomonadales bacterium]|nr:ATP-binding protein [Xanthomonadales bacterium]
MSADFGTDSRDVLRTLHLLIVDDNPGDRLLYKQMLAEADPATDYEFDEAGTGAQALERFTERMSDCILLDYLLPDMLGTELLTALAERLPTLPAVVMLTGFGDEATAVSALQNGAHGYLSKRELTGQALSRAVERALRADKNQRMLERSRREMAERNSELEQKYEQIEQFYSKILSRLQQPVRSLRDCAAALGGVDGPAAERHLDQKIKSLQAQSERLVMTLSNFMDNPGIDLGQLLISTAPASITEVISDSANTFRHASQAAGVRLSVQVQPGLPDVQIDRYRIEQVLSNLLDNAIRHTPDRGRISLRVNRFPETPQEITVAVSDSGAGIPADRLASLFDRQPGAGVVPGASDEPTGFGLHICREIIRAHKGHISAQSPPGAGTCITFTLPLEKGPARAHEVWEPSA